MIEICQAFLNFSHHINKISSQFFAIIITTVSIDQNCYSKILVNFLPNWRIAASQKYFPHELILQGFQF